MATLWFHVLLLTWALILRSQLFTLEYACQGAGFYLSGVVSPLYCLLISSTIRVGLLGLVTGVISELAA